VEKASQSDCDELEAMVCCHSLGLMPFQRRLRDGTVARRN